MASRASRKGLATTQAYISPFLLKGRHFNSIPPVWIVQAVERGSGEEVAGH